MIVEAQNATRSLLEALARTLAPGVIVDHFDDPLNALASLQQVTPALILADYRLTGMSGIELIRQVRAIRRLADVPLIVVTVAEDRQIRSDALASGTSDFLSRPIDPQEFRARCLNLLALRRSQKQVAERAKWLEDQVMAATREVRTRERETLLRLAKAGEYRDQDTGNHIIRMAKYARLIAEELTLTTMECDEIEAAAPMHDIGKIGIPDHILLKPGRHTPDEQIIMRRHPLIGHEILAGSPSRYLQMGAIIALGHHEKFDGSGYPGGLTGEAIPLTARIVAVADVFDALTSVRPYKTAWTFEQTFDYVKAESGKHFDPACVYAFEQRIDAVATIKRELSDSRA
ncbi:MAG: two-component system response regulator [Hydrogenophilales bacterium 28-61-11]|nr:MAG: two-component system response regulator [Hydrogenophilales bacterium 28-61-11]OYZ55905.1 MAG: two-component system response regulator [Hydrogenophilales bacterium 16-61-112]OZA42232.1 MAG: two-component system response regulator [Hydrogenophilales bacterium 17-61-76]